MFKADEPMKFRCNRCLTEYDTAGDLSKFNNFVSRWSGSAYVDPVCNYCAAKAEDDQRAYEARQNLWKTMADKYPRVFNHVDGCDIDGNEVVKAGWYSFECGIGWLPLIEALAKDITELLPEGAHMEIVQVKEKFGGLRFYNVLHGVQDAEVFDAINNCVDNAEDASYLTCEVCGLPGRTRDGSWIRTLCDEHAGVKKAEPEDLDTTV